MSIVVASSNPAPKFLLFYFFLPIFSHSFHDCREMKKVSIILLCILTCFIQLYSVIKHAHWTVIENMTEKSAESCVSLKGNNKAIFNSSKCYKGNGGSKKMALFNQNI